MQDSAAILPFPAPALAAVVPLNHAAFPHYRRLHTMLTLAAQTVDATNIDDIQRRSALRHLIVELGIATDDLTDALQSAPPMQRRRRARFWPWRRHSSSGVHAP